MMKTLRRLFFREGVPTQHGSFRKTPGILHRMGEKIRGLWIGIIVEGGHPIVPRLPDHFVTSTAGTQQGLAHHQSHLWKPSEHGLANLGTAAIDMHRDRFSSRIAGMNPLQRAHELFHPPVSGNDDSHRNRVFHRKNAAVRAQADLTL